VTVGARRSSTGSSESTHHRVRATPVRRWVTTAEKEALVSELDALAASPDPDAAGFGRGADALAGHIESVFGTSSWRRDARAPSP